VAVSFCLIFALSPELARANDVEHHLRDQYQGKAFVLRGFYSGDRLRYDARGSAGAANAGDWTIDGFLQLEQIRLSGQTLKIKSKRSG
jgi:hypothetical protein